MLLMSMILVIIVYILFLILYYKKIVSMEEISIYECGFDPNSLTRIVFSYRFYLISILFIIFDVEISLMMSIPYTMSFNMGMWIFMIFIAVLLIGLLYEYKCGSLEWLEYS